MSVPIAEQVDNLKSKLEEKGDNVETMSIDASDTRPVPEPVKKVNGS